MVSVHCFSFAPLVPYVTIHTHTHTHLFLWLLLPLLSLILGNRSMERKKLNTLSLSLPPCRITFSRAKDLATKFKIVDLLYPLFTDDPSQFLCTTSDSGLSVPSGDTASVETAQTSSTVKSLVGPPPPSGTTHSMSPYKTADLSSYHYMPPSWENRPPYSSLANNDCESLFYLYLCLRY